WRESLHHGAAMRVRRTNGDAFGLNMSLPFQSSHDLLTHTGRHAAIIHRNNHGGVLAVAADGKRFGPKPLGHPFGLSFSHRITRQSNRVLRRDINLSYANLAKF